MDIREFCSKEESPSQELHSKYDQIKDSEDFKQVEADYGDFIAKCLQDYGNKSEKELISDIVKLINQKKLDGTFDAEQIKKVAYIVKPFLDEKQQNKLEKLLLLLN